MNKNAWPFFFIRLALHVEVLQTKMGQKTTTHKMKAKMNYRIRPLLPSRGGCRCDSPPRFRFEALARVLCFPGFGCVIGGVRIRTEWSCQWLCGRCTSWTACWTTASSSLHVPTRLRTGSRLRNNHRRGDEQQRPKASLLYLSLEVALQLHSANA